MVFASVRYVGLHDEWRILTRNTFSGTSYPSHCRAMPVVFNSPVSWHNLLIPTTPSLLLLPHWSRGIIGTIGLAIAIYRAYGFLSNSISRIVAEISCVNQLTRYIPNEYWSPFWYFKAKVGAVAFFNFWAYSSPRDGANRQSVHGPQYCGVRTLPLKMQYGGEKMCKIWEGLWIFNFALKRSYFSGPKQLCKISSKSNRNCDSKSDNRQKDSLTHSLLRVTGYGS